LTYRARSKQELCTKLGRKKFDPEIISAVIAYLEKLGYLDDAKFSRDYLRQNLRLRPKSLRFLGEKLREKGVSKEIIAQEISALAPEVNESQIIADLVSRRSKLYAKLSRERRKQRLFQYLRRRGFSAQQILQSLDKDSELNDYDG
jgi:regulatory protein